MVDEAVVVEPPADSPNPVNPAPPVAVVKPGGGARALRVVLVLLELAGFVAAIGTAGYFYRQNQLLRADASTKTNRDIAALVRTIGKVYQLPDETPTLAVVSDAATLRTQQPFFSRAENGDKVLIYQQAKKAIIFRPSTKKIIEVGPVTGSSAASSKADSTSESQSPLASPVSPADQTDLTVPTKTDGSSSTTSAAPSTP